MKKRTIFLSLATITSASIVFFAILSGQGKHDTIISLDSASKYQTIVGWEATAQAGQTECPGFDRYKNVLFDQAINDLGINRLRVEIKSGTENPVDYFTQWQNGQITRDGWKNHWSEIVNDDPDPNSINHSGFHFSAIDDTIDRVVLPLKQRVEANGEHLYINVNYVDFGSSSFEHKNNPNEYAEFVLATYQHLQSKYGWAPDAWEVILEPDTSKASWSADQIGDAIVAAAAKLKANGFAPKFVVPSTTNMGNSIRMFDQLTQMPGVLKYVSELAYHRYAGVSDANLQMIASRAVQYGINTAMLEHIGSDYQDLHKDLKLGRNSAWQQYTLGYCGNDNGGSYYRIDVSSPNNPIVVKGTRTKFLRQYFKFVRTGAVRFQASSDLKYFDPLAFINTNGGYVIIVNAEIGGAINIDGLPPGVYGIKYTTERQYDVDLPNVELRSGQVLDTMIPGKGVITIYTRTDESQSDFSSKLTDFDRESQSWQEPSKACIIKSIYKCRKR